MSINIIVSGLVLWVFALSLCYNEAIVFKLTNAVCTSYNESWFKVQECRLKAINRNKTIYNLNLSILHPVENAVVEGQIFQKANGYKPWLYKASLDACRFIKKPYNPVAIIVFRIIKNYTNLNHTCPYKKEIVINGFYPKFELLPHAIPTGEYLLTLKWILNQKLQLTTSWYFQFVEDW